MRCLGSAQRLRSRYGRGYQIEIGQVLPDNDRISGMADTIANALKGAPSSSASASASTAALANPIVAAAPDFVDTNLTRDQMNKAFTALSKEHWISRITLVGTGADIQASFNTTNTVTLRHLASWWLLEAAYDDICEHLTKTFGNFSLRERHSNKLRVEVSAVDPKGNQRNLSSMFAAIEARKADLMMQDYSIAQTSLEQIFNHFAAQVR
jgi:hypothetical protein